MFKNEKKKLLLIILFSLILINYIYAAEALLPNGGFEDGAGVTAEEWVRFFVDSGPFNSDINMFPDQADQNGSWLLSDENCSLGSFCGKLEGVVIPGKSEYWGWVNKEPIFNDQNVTFDLNVGADGSAHLKYGTTTPTAFTFCTNASASFWETCIGFVGPDDAYTPGGQNNLTRVAPSACSVGCYAYFYGDGLSNKGVKRTTLDNVRRVTTDTLTNTIIEPPEPVLVNTPFDINITVNDGNSDISDAIVKVSFDNGVFETIDYNSAFAVYTFDHNGEIVVPGDYNYAVWTTRASDIEDYDEGIIEIAIDYREFIIINPIQNIGAVTIDVNLVTIETLIKDKTIEWEAKSSFDISDVIVNYRIQDYDDTGKYAYAWTAINGGDFSFNDSLTYGTVTNNPIQKIWDSVRDSYNFQFEDSLSSDNNDFFRLQFYDPMFRTDDIESETKFSIAPPPILFDLNGIFVDLFTVSQFSDLLIELLPDHVLPDLSATQDVKEAYVLTFTAWTDTGSVTVYADSNGSTNSALITTTPRTFAFPARNDLNIFTLTSTSHGLYMDEFMIHERGYFTQDLIIIDEFNQPLPTWAIGTDVYQYIKEGEPFRVITQAYDKNAIIETMKIEIYLTVVSDENRIRFFEWNIDPPESGGIINISELIPGIIVLDSEIPSGTNLKIRISLCDANETCFAEQERSDIRFHQYPFKRSDVKMNLEVFEEMTFEHPFGRVMLDTTNPNALEYVIISIYDSDSSITASDFNKLYRKDEFFTCDFSGNCDFEWFWDEWIYPDFDKFYTFQLTAKYTTQNLDYDNNVLNQKLTVYVRAKGYGRLRSLHIAYDGRATMSPARQYRSFEKIPIMFALNDGTNLPLKDDVKVNLLLWDLGTTEDGADGAEDANFLPIIYYPRYYRYDENSGTNFWVFMDRFRESDNTPLEQAHYYRIAVITEDESRKHMDGNYTCLSFEGLTCDTNDAADPLLATNEATIFINDNATLTEPANQRFDCVSLDAPTLQEIGKSLSDRAWGIFSAVIGIATPQQAEELGELFVEIVITPALSQSCGVFWEDDQMQVEAITIWIYNENSDLTESDPLAQQFIKFTIPQEHLLFNDFNATRQEALINLVNEGYSGYKNIGDIDFMGMLVQAADLWSNPLIRIDALINFEETKDEFQSKYLRSSQDHNMAEVLPDATNLVMFNLESLQPINKSNFLEILPESRSINNKNFREWLIKENGFDDSDWPKAKLTLLQNGRVWDEFEIDNKLVVDIPYSNIRDRNGLVSGQYNYWIRADLIYNQGWSALDPVIFKGSDEMILTVPEKPLGLIIADFLKDPAGEILTLLRDMSFIILLVAFTFAVVLGGYIAVHYGLIDKAGTTVNNFIRKR